MWDLRTLGLVKNFNWPGVGGSDPKGSSSLYSCKFINPQRNAIIACGSNKNSVKVFSTETGNLLHDMSTIDPIICKSAVVAVDTSN